MQPSKADLWPKSIVSNMKDSILREGKKNAVKQKRQTFFPPVGRVLAIFVLHGCSERYHI